MRLISTFEENETVMGLVYDVSAMVFDDVLGTYSGDLAVRDNTERVLIAFVTTSGDSACTSSFSTTGAAKSSPATAARC